MSDKTTWQRVKFGDVVRQVKDKVDVESSNLERYIAGEHMNTDDLRIRRWGTINDGYLGPAFHMRFKPGHILYGSRRTYLRKVAVPEFEGICANTTFVLEPKDPTGVLLPEFLPFIMQTESFHEHSIKQSKGSVNPYVNFSDLAWYEFALPPLEEQRRIIELLSSSYDLVEGSKLLIEKSRLLVSSFTKQRLEKHMQDFSSLPIPEITTRLTVGIVVKPAEWYVQNGLGVPALRSLNVFPDRLELSDLIYISKEGHEIHEKSQLQAGDIVIVRTGRPGDAAVIPSNLGPLNCIDLIITTPSPRILAEYLVYYLNSPVGRQQFASGSAGTAQQHFNVKEFRNLRIPCPPITVQSAFINEINYIKWGQIQAKTRYNTSIKIHQRLLNQTLGVEIE